MIRVFLGHDPREEVGSHVFVSSMLEHASVPVAITHLHTPVLESTFGRKFANGSNAFTKTRFLVPALCDFVGTAVFIDGADMLCRGDIAQIVEDADELAPVSVVKHAYMTRNPRKYIGTSMESENEDYERKQWASVMVMRCWHRAWRRLSPDAVADMRVIDLLQFRFLQDEQIGSLHLDWNWVCDELGPNPNAKIVHWTTGIPGLKHYEDAYHSDEWRAQLKKVNYATE